MEAIRAGASRSRGEMVLLQQVENRHRALVLDIGAAPDDGMLVKRNVDDAGLFASPMAALYRVAPDRGGSPARRRARAVPRLRPARSPPGPSAARLAGIAARPAIVRFMKSSTPRPEEKRALRAVGNTWFGPGDVVADRLRRVAAEEDRAGMTHPRRPALGVVEGELEMLGRDPVDQRRRLVPSRRRG